MFLDTIYFAGICSLFCCWFLPSNFIWYSPGDWSYAEEELKLNLGKSFLVYG